MGYDFQKRISSLRRQVDLSEGRPIGLVKALFVSLLLSLSLIFLLPAASGAFKSSSAKSDMPWREEISGRFKERYIWLKASPLSSFGTHSHYFHFSEAVIRGLVLSDGSSSSQGLMARWGQWCREVLAELLLRIGFISIAFWPAWLAFVLLLYASTFVSCVPRRKTTEDILGVCDRHASPFYSGIYGSFRANGKKSGTDFACPGLACPQMESKTTAARHELGAILREFAANNETNLALLRIVLAHRDFPGKVDLHYAGDAGESSLENSALAGLKSVLETHRELDKLFAGGSEVGATYSKFCTVVGQLSKHLSPLARILMNSLTPASAKAIAQVPSAMIATAALALEAGKSLVYKRDGQTFTKISHFPHLQARAVLHSIPAYFSDYDGDMRLLLRQAIICSRRHEDFGRVFLPDGMPEESRGLRDWLEILYSSDEDAKDIASLIELEKHMEEIHDNWQQSLKKHLGARIDYAQSYTGRTLLKKTERLPGIIYKSVFLLPLIETIGLALKGFEVSRCQHIAKLIDTTKGLRSKLSSSCRLPGFKRDADTLSTDSFESSRVSKMLRQCENGDEILDRWIIVKGMLLHYNWLSTRAGDSSVPSDGFIQAIVEDSRTTADAGTTETTVVGHDALIPLRQRRLTELLGETWKELSNSDEFSPGRVNVFSKPELYSQALKHKTEGSVKKIEDKRNIFNLTASGISGTTPEH